MWLSSSIKFPSLKVFEIKNFHFYFSIDPINNVFSGIQFRVRWHDPAHLPVELAKLELFSSDSGGHLLSRLDIIKDEKRGMIDKNR